MHLYAINCRCEGDEHEEHRAIITAPTMEIALRSFFAHFHPDEPTVHATGGEWNYEAAMYDYRWETSS